MTTYSIEQSFENFITSFRSKWFFTLLSMDEKSMTASFSIQHSDDVYQVQGIETKTPYGFPDLHVSVNGTKMDGIAFMHFLDERNPALRAEVIYVSIEDIMVSYMGQTVYALTDTRYELGDFLSVEGTCQMPVKPEPIEMGLISEWNHNAVIIGEKIGEAVKKHE